jgi:hypothetical protein
MKNKSICAGFSLLLALVIPILPVSQVIMVSAQPAGCVAGPHHGSITTSETWCPGDVHLVDYGVTVLLGVTLTIEPGVVVKFDSGASLGVAGSLVANGSVDQPITFTSSAASPAPGSWQGIMAVDGATLQLNYTELAFAGQAGFAFGALAIYTSNATISHSHIHHGMGTALFLDTPGITPQFNDVEIDHNTGVAIVQNKISMNPSFVNMRLHENAMDGLQFPYPGNTDRDVTLDGSPAALNGAPIYINYGFIVGAGTTLTITPGTILKNIEGISVATTATLIAEGTLDLPIVFTGFEDTPSPGSWQGIRSVAGSNLQMSNFEMAYAGRPGFDLGSLAIHTSGATISHGRIHDCQGTGLFLDDPGVTPQFNDVEIDHNTGMAIVQNTISMNPSFVNMRLHDNAWDGLQLPYPGTSDRDVILDGSPAALNGAPIYLNYGVTVGAGTTLTITPGTTLKSIEGISVAASATLVAEGTPSDPIIFSAIQDLPAAGSWVGILANPDSTLKLSYCELAYAGRQGFWVGTLNIATSNATVRQCRIHDSLGHGIYINGVHPFALWNDVLTDISEVALFVDHGGTLEAMHTTLAHNQVGLYVPSGSATLTNTIVANNSFGVKQEYTGSISLTHTLFQGNTTPKVGAVGDTYHIDGSVGSEADGYHISRNSDAIDVGMTTGVNIDIDGDPRPVGPGPDLGADEYRDAVARIGDENGGDMTYVDDQGDPTEVTVPPGAVDQDTVLTFTVIESVTPPLTFRQTGHAFHLDGYQGGFLVPGLEFDQPVRITLHYSDADVLGLDRKTLTLWYWNGNAWADASCGEYERHPTQNWLSVSVCHLSRFSFFGQTYRVLVPVIKR